MDDINDHYILYNQSELIITKCNYDKIFDVHIFVDKINNDNLI